VIAASLEDERLEESVNSDEVTMLPAGPENIHIDV
jgi:hypothetical protein